MYEGPKKRSERAGSSASTTAGAQERRATSSGFFMLGSSWRRGSHGADAGAGRVARKERFRDAELGAGQLLEDVAEVGGGGEVAVLEELARGEPRPLSEHAPAADAAAEHDHRVARAVVSPVRAVDAGRAPELRGDEEHHVVELAAEVGGERGEGGAEVLVVVDVPEELVGVRVEGA